MGQGLLGGAVSAPPCVSLHHNQQVIRIHLHAFFDEDVFDGAVSVKKSAE